MPRITYSHGEHMAQLGKVTGLLEAQTKIQGQIIKEQKKLKILEQKQRKKVLYLGNLKVINQFMIKMENFKNML